jgi:hypothetical protein
MSNKIDYYGNDEEIGTTGVIENNDYFMLPAGSILYVHVYEGNVLNRIKKYSVLQDMSIETHARPFKVCFLGSEPNPNFKKEKLEEEIKSLEDKLNKLKTQVLSLC